MKFIKVSIKEYILNAISNRLKKEKLIMEYRLMGVNPIIIEALFSFTKDVEKSKYILGIIFKAKKEVSNSTGALILFEKLTDEDNIKLLKTLLRALRKEYNYESIDNFDTYLFVAFREYFEAYVYCNGLADC